jgi:hypothetical protein
MLQISTRFENEQRTVDVHAVRVPGANVLATDLCGPDLYRELVKLKVPGILPSHGHQDLAFRLGVWIQRRDEAASRAAKAAVSA